MAGVGDIENSAINQSSKSNRTAKLSAPKDTSISPFNESPEVAKLDEIVKALEELSKDKKRPGTDQKSSIQDVAMEMAKKAMRKSDSPMSQSPKSSSFPSVTTPRTPDYDRDNSSEETPNLSAPDELTMDDQSKSKLEEIAKLLVMIAAGGGKPASSEEDIFSETVSAKSNLEDAAKSSGSGDEDNGGNSSRSNSTTKLADAGSDVFSNKEDKFKDLIQKIDELHKDQKKQLEGLMQKVSIQSVLMEVATKSIKSAEESVNRYASTYEKSLAQMVSTMSQSQKEYQRLILSTTDVLISSGTTAAKTNALISSQSETMKVLRSNTLNDRVSMINLIGESFTKFSGKAISLNN